MTDNTIISNELINLIETLKELESDEIIVLMPNANIKAFKNKKIIVSILEISGDTIKGVNGDNGKLGTAYNIMLGIKSIGEEPLKDIRDTYEKIIEKLEKQRYREGVSNITYDEVGLPVVFTQFKTRKYGGI